jgi:ferric-dicitrate binding protein FerR (iron transport regulator)
MPPPSNPCLPQIQFPGNNRLRLSATFRSDTSDGFVRLMVSDFGMHAERRSDTDIILGGRGDGKVP